MEQLLAGRLPEPSVMDQDPPEDIMREYDTRTGQTISFIMRKVLIAISNSATISSEGLIVQLLGVLIADVLIMDPHNAHLAISRFMPHASRRAPA